jgi:hypothetical protein
MLSAECAGSSTDDTTITFSTDTLTTLPERLEAREMETQGTDGIVVAATTTDATSSLCTAGTIAADTAAIAAPTVSAAKDPKRNLTARMQKATDIAARYDARGGVLPRYVSNKRPGAQEQDQEYKDADKLKYWKSALAAGNCNQCPPALATFLDCRMPGERKRERGEVL